MTLPSKSHCPCCNTEVRLTKEDKQCLFVACPNDDCAIKEFFYDMVGPY